MSGNRRRARLNDIAGIVGALREPVETPDFTCSILERVHAEKPFVPPQTRRLLPLVRLGAAGAAAMAVFIVTLIIFIRPDLPERLGAPPSVTTELLLSAESGVTDNIVELRSSLRVFSAAADPRRLTALSVPLAAESLPEGSPFTLPDVLVAHAAPEPPSDIALVSFLTVPGPIPAPVAVAIPQGGAPLMADADLRAFISPSFADVSSAAAEYRRGSLPWQRSALVSHTRRSPVVFSTNFTVTRPAPNPGAPTLVKELVPLITGQPAGDDMLLR